MFVTLFAGYKIDETLIVTVETMDDAKNVSSPCVVIYSSVSSHRGLSHFQNLLFIAIDITLYLKGKRI